jgi:hypothetical protein
MSTSNQLHLPRLSIGWEDTAWSNPPPPTPTHNYGGTSSSCAPSYPGSRVGGGVRASHKRQTGQTTLVAHWVAHTMPNECKGALRPGATRGHAPEPTGH